MKKEAGRDRRLSCGKAVNPPFVILGLDPRIQASLAAWMARSSPTMTEERYRAKRRPVSVEGSGAGRQWFPDVDTIGSPSVCNLQTAAYIGHNEAAAQAASPPQKGL